MPTGSCLCGEIKIAFSGSPKFTAICYCNDDRKMSSVQTFQIPKASFEVTHGTPKEWTKRSDHGSDITNHFCNTCGTVLFRSGGHAVNDENIGLRAGVLDDQAILNTPPAIEVYVERRPPWIKQIDGAIQLNGKYEPVDSESAALFGKQMQGAS